MLSVITYAESHQKLQVNRVGVQISEENGFTVTPCFLKKLLRRHTRRSFN